MRGVGDLVGDHRAARAALVRPAPDVRVVEEPVDDQLAAALEEIEQARLAVRAVERVVLSTSIRGIRRRFAASASRARVSSFSLTSSSSRAAFHSWGETICGMSLRHQPRRERNGDAMLARARGGDEDAFRELTAPYRRELQLHGYRMLGSLQDAEDVVQETLLAAWHGLEGFEGRSSVRAWLYRIATNRCLNLLRDRGRRPREVPPLPDPPEPTHRTEPVWLDPYPGPDVQYEQREAVGLAFVTALQRLPARQRAVLVLRDALGFQLAEVAAMLGTGETAAKGALQRARATLGEPAPATTRLPSAARERELVDRFADAVESGDIDAVIALLTDDALLTMPPQPLVYVGHAEIAAFLRYSAERRGAPLRVVPARANGQPAFACYLTGRPYGMIVLTLDDAGVSAITWFSDPGAFRHFGLPERL
jgi:RNA polymerase sigma-70 factor (ECF subfamily)